jgi:hypothetical protein
MAVLMGQNEESQTTQRRFTFQIAVATYRKQAGLNRSTHENSCRFARRCQRWFAGDIEKRSSFRLQLPRQRTDFANSIMLCGTSIEKNRRKLYLCSNRGLAMRRADRAKTYQVANNSPVFSGFYLFDVRRIGISTSLMGIVQWLRITLDLPRSRLG